MEKGRGGPIMGRHFSPKYMSRVITAMLRFNWHRSEGFALIIGISAICRELMFLRKRSIKLSHMFDGSKSRWGSPKSARLSVQLTSGAAGGNVLS